MVPAEHASFAGEARFINVFDGELAAGEHPKILWYLFLTAVYVAATAAWAALCFRYRSELLPTQVRLLALEPHPALLQADRPSPPFPAPVQWYIGYVIAYLAVEMFVTFVYYRYFNAHGASTGSTAFIVVVSILNAGRNSSSFFLLLVVVRASKSPWALCSPQLTSLIATPPAGYGSLGRHADARSRHAPRSASHRRPLYLWRHLLARNGLGRARDGQPDWSTRHCHGLERHANHIPDVDSCLT